MANKAKCKKCNILLLPTEKCRHQNTTYCNSCIQIIIRENELEKNKKKLEKKLKQKPSSNPKEDGYKELIDIICKYFKINEPTPLILKQIKDFKNKFKHLYTGLHYCLWYVTEIENKKLDLSYGIALLQFYYDKAKQYYEQQQKIIESAQNIDYTKMKTNVVKINLNKVYDKKSRYLIDITQFCEEG